MRRIEDLDTPAIVIDLDRVEANLKRAQDHADARGLKLRPHIKTHKLPRFALRQVELGAVGINCQKLGEAEVMADAGLDDILVTFNILGAAKLGRLETLNRRVTMAVVADSAAVLEGYTATFRDAARPLTVLVECDTGAVRCGVVTPAEVLPLARAIEAAPGLRFGGLMTYPPKDSGARVGAWLGEALSLLAEDGIEVPVVSSGGTPGLYSAGGVPGVTEHRPGTYIYLDRMQVGWGVGTFEDCALTVLATVVSRPTPGRAVIDAGSKSLSTDPCSLPGHGHIVEHPEARLARLSEEHGVIETSGGPSAPRIGEKVRVIPNHVCAVTNLFNRVHLVREGVLVEELPVAARGLVS
jgi:D-serine deaminase-like pyridoxal phosphate-dependent protein